MQPVNDHKAAPQLAAWRQLAKLATRAPQPKIAELLQDAERGRSLRLAVDGALFDFSQQGITTDILQALLNLAEERCWAQQVQALFNGGQVNSTERQAALHTALRAPESGQPEAAGLDVLPTRRRLGCFAESIRRGDRLGHSGKAFKRVVHIGIGGSHLGPALITDALGGPASPLKITYVANIDGQAITDALAAADAETTMFIIVSKSFSTLETKVNAATARSWFLERTNQLDAVAQHFFAVTANVEAAKGFGIPPQNIFPLWAWVGGRFSLWSSVGLPIALHLGEAVFNALLAGAHAMDQHFSNAPAAANAPLLAALIDIWNYSFLGVDSQLILPYQHRLRLLPAYLQQLETESNGKSTRHDGADVGVHTIPAVWGGEGTVGQHAFHQLLHQGTGSFAADFILVSGASHGLHQHQRWLLANGLAQSQALALGWPSDDPQRSAPGNHGVNTFLLDRLDPHRLGLLLAFYEHRVFCQGVIWGINSFDQWGVEFGKRLASGIFDQLGEDAAPGRSAANRTLIEAIRASRSTTEDDDSSSQ